MQRRLFILCTAVSLVLILALGAFWVFVFISPKFDILFTSVRFLGGWEFELHADSPLWLAILAPLAILPLLAVPR